MWLNDHKTLKKDGFNNPFDIVVRMDFIKGKHFHEVDRGAMSWRLETLSQHSLSSQLSGEMKMFFFFI